MTVRRLLVALLVAVAGYGSLAYLFQTWNPAARWDVTIDREAAVARGREIASEQGVDVESWDVFVGSVHDSDIERVLALRPDLEGSLFFSPVAFRVVFHRRDGGEEESFRVRLDAGGRLTAYLHRSSAAASARPLPEAARTAAERALRILAGDEAGGYRLVSSRDHGRDAVLYVWERTASELPEATVRIEVLARNGGAGEARAEVLFDDRFEERRLWPGRRGTETLGQVKGSILGLTVLAVLIAYVAYLVQGEPFRRGPLVAGAVAFVLVSAITLASVGHGIPGSFFGDLDTGVGDVVAIILGFMLVVFVLLIPILGAGRVAARRASPQAIASLELIVTGRPLSRPPASAVAFGLLLGGAAAAVPYLVAASSFFPGVWISGHGADLLTLPAAFSLWKLDIVVFLTLLELFGFVAPQLDLRLKRRWLARILFLVPAAFALTLIEIEMPLSAALAEGALLAMFYDRVYRHFDFLTVLIAASAGRVAENALALLVQPASAHRNAAALVLAGLGVGLVGALFVAFRGREGSVDFSAETRGPGRSEREQVRAEMQIARRAQLEMLPPSSPSLEKYAISAVCEPAREVGGDLYDFLELPGGCLGIAVGDVAGKGMGAAYYMALTKGLLLGAAEGRRDPKETLAEVNRAFFKLKAGRVFVTMFYGVLDPAAGTLTYVRAGHNPVLWRRASRGETLAPCPSGLALGMDRGKLFERTLRVKEIAIEPGDGLFFYSDGITEAMNRRFEDYGDERLVGTVGKTDGLGAEAAKDLILADVASFVGEAPSYDDVTLVVIRAL